MDGKYFEINLIHKSYIHAPDTEFHPVRWFVRLDDKYKPMAPQCAHTLMSRSRVVTTNSLAYFKRCKKQNRFCIDRSDYIPFRYKVLSIKPIKFIELPQSCRVMDWVRRELGIPQPVLEEDNVNDAC